MTPTAVDRRTAPAWRTAAPAILGVAVIALQIAYPLTPEGPPRHALTIATVLVFCTASVTHAALQRGPRFAAALVAITAGGGLVVEALGVATGVPFGAYRYGSSLGPQLLGVPVVIPLAWTMMGYPAYVVGRRISGGGVAGPLAAGAALATWDLFLDPQMVAAGHWTWAGTSGPELLGIPAVNFLGWFVVATAMMALLWRRALHAPRHAIFLGNREWAATFQGKSGSGEAESRGCVRRPDDRVPVALYLWTYGSSVLAHAAFFDLPGSALVGGIGMGAVVAAFLGAQRRAA